MLDSRLRGNDKCMELFIDTTEYGKIKLTLRESSKVISKAEKNTSKISESLLSEIDKLLRRRKIKLENLKNIAVNPGPGGFSSTRTGVATANALNYVLGINKVVLPIYSKAPNITTPHPSPLPQGARGKRRI